MMDTPLQRGQIYYLHFYSLLKKQVGQTEHFGVNSWHGYICNLKIRNKGLG